MEWPDLAKSALQSIGRHHSRRDSVNPPDTSTEATWGATRFACSGVDLLSWKANDGESPGASARNRYVAVKAHGLYAHDR